MVFVIPVVDGIAEGLIGAEGGTTAGQFNPLALRSVIFQTRA